MCIAGFAFSQGVNDKDAVEKSRIQREKSLNLKSASIQKDVKVSYSSAYNYDETFNYTGTLQSFVVPPGVILIYVETYGAQGGNGYSRVGGNGAYMSGEFPVIPGKQLDILVGEWPGDENNGGGGGTFVVENITNIPLIIAGGWIESIYLAVIWRRWRCCRKLL